MMTIEEEVFDPEATLEEFFAENVYDEPGKGWANIDLTGAELEEKSQPTEAQKEAGNYKKQHIKFNGLDISLENKAGSVRRGTNKSGEEWSCKMHYDYGYIRRTEGVDGDHVDVYVGPNEDALYVYVVHQANPTTGDYDEDKCMLGFDSEEDAKAAYLKQYDDPNFLGAISAVPFALFKEKVLDDKGEPVVPNARVLVIAAKAKSLVRPHRILTETDLRAQRILSNDELPLDILTRAVTAAWRSGYGQEKRFDDGTNHRIGQGTQKARPQAPFQDQGDQDSGGEGEGDESSFMIFMSSPAAPAAVGNAPGAGSRRGLPTTTNFLFGVFDLQPFLMAPPWTGGIFTTLSANNAAQQAATRVLLEAARAAKMKVLAHVTGGRSNYQDGDLHYDLALWQDRALNFATGFDLNPYIADGTVVGHLLFDEPQDAVGNWGGISPTYAQLKGTSDYSKTLWPSLKAGMGSNWDWMNLQGSWVNTSMDFCITPVSNQNLTQLGLTIEGWRNKQIADTPAGKFVYLSMNAVAGGVQQGTPVLTGQLQQWLDALVDPDLSCPPLAGVTIYQYDAQDGGAYILNPDHAGVFMNTYKKIIKKKGCT